MRGFGLSGIYKGRLINMRDPKATHIIPRRYRGGPIRMRAIKEPTRLRCYYGPPEKQKDPFAINLYDPKKNRKKK